MSRKSLITILILVGLTAATTFAARPGTKARNFDASALVERADQALTLYDADALAEVIEEWEDHLSRSKNATPPAELTELQNRLIALRNMLQRVEQIVIVDSLSVDTAEFFTHYRLSREAGRIAGNSSETSFVPASNREAFFTMRDSAGNFSIMYAGILDDGTREASSPLAIPAVRPSNRAYPFLLSDGMTLYFADDIDTDGALGAYDIYMTRRDENGEYLEPTNVGMPYNSPANDYMMAIDETTGLGWWATDRNAPDGMVTIYVFKPNDSRVNYPVDKSNLADLAFITSVRETWPEGYNPEADMQRLESIAGSAGGSTATSFFLSTGNGKVVHSLSELPNDSSRQLMTQYLMYEREYQASRAKLDALRRSYYAGDTTVGGEILRLERDQEKARADLLSRRNAVIKAIRN